MCRMDTVVSASTASTLVVAVTLVASTTTASTSTNSKRLPPLRQLVDMAHLPYMRTIVVACTLLRVSVSVTRVAPPFGDCCVLTALCCAAIPGTSERSVCVISTRPRTSTTAQS
eukprot:TRINITY_DN24143_c0_g1_i15.p1 TRINITY_DN24143_c0_g1~~TRINITY_DN24143_c0_g1_i15.p1  ORF type:complete len:114 (+),score=3.55 TRINITY_DN24143_c0_g1_i15:282-623(+)